MDAAQSKHEPIKAGRSIEDACESIAGGHDHHAILLADLASEVYATAEEWAYDESQAAIQLVRMCRELEEFLTHLSLTSDGEITLYRECSRCSGAGKTKGEDPCIDCGGSGSIHAEEADG